MANKNSWRKRRELRKQMRSGNKQVVSQNKTRNMQMVVVHEVNEAGKVVGSITRHIVIDDKLPAKPHKQARGGKNNFEE
jgi:hypothetical protein